MAVNSRTEDNPKSAFSYALPIDYRLFMVSLFSLRSDLSIRGIHREIMVCNIHSFLTFEKPKFHEEISRFSDYTFFETRVSFSSACAGDYNIGGEGMRNPGEPPFQQWI
jgi:hypothetical protein